MSIVRKHLRKKRRGKSIVRRHHRKISVKRRMDMSVKDVNELLLLPKEIRVGDYIRTTPKYHEDLSTLSPKRGRVYKVINRPAKNRLLGFVDKEGNKNFIDEGWVNKNIPSRSIKMPEPIMKGDFVRSIQEWDESLGTPLYGRIVKDDGTVVQLVDKNNKKISVGKDWLKKVKPAYSIAGFDFTIDDFAKKHGVKVTNDALMKKYIPDIIKNIKR